MKRIPRGAKKLDIDVQGATSIEQLAEIETLETLSLRGYKMNLAPLASLSRLRSLSLDLSRDVKGLEHLASLTALRTLRIHESALDSLEIVSGMKQLVALHIKGGVNTAKGIGGASKLQKLALERTQITTLAPLAPLTKLRELSLMFSRKLVDLAGIEKLKELRELRLMEMRGTIRTLAPVAKLAKLEYLDTSLTKIKGGLSPIFKLRKLRVLEADASSPAEYAALQQQFPKAQLFVDVDDDAGECIKVGEIKVYKPQGVQPWTIYQDLVDDLEVDDQNDVEERVSAAFKKAQPKLHKKILFDSEGDAFCATSSDRSAIMALAKLITRLIEDVDESDEDDE